MLDSLEQLLDLLVFFVTAVVLVASGGPESCTFLKVGASAASHFLGDLGHFVL